MAEPDPDRHTRSLREARRPRITRPSDQRDVETVAEVMSEGVAHVLPPRHGWPGVWSGEGNFDDVVDGRAALQDRA